MSTAHGEQVRVLEEQGAQPGRSLEWWGMIFFICSEALIFANLIAAYLYLEIRAGGGWHPLGDIINPLISSFFLFASSGTMHWGAIGIRKGDMRRFNIGLAATIVLGAIFLGRQVMEYVGLYSNHFTLSFSTFGSAFFTLTGFHGLHVTIGLILLTIVLIRSLLGHFTQKKHFVTEAAEMYWHFVDIVWVFVFSLVYLLPFLYK